MAHFAEINDSNIVTKVIVIHNNEITVDGQELEFKGIILQVRVILGIVKMMLFMHHNLMQVGH